MNYTAVVSYKEKLTPNVYLVRFKLTNPVEINFQAGQFISLLVAPNIRRCYSIASSPNNKNELDFVVDVRPGGPGSQFFTNVNVNDQVSFMAPFGQFTLKEQDPPKLFFVCTGTGVAPFRSIIYDLLEKGTTKEISLFFGLRFEEDQFYVNDFQALTQKYPNFHFTLTLSRPTPAWTGKSGYVTKWLEEIPNDQFGCCVYICGWKEVVNSVIDICHKKGVADEFIHFESYG